MQRAVKSSTLIIHCKLYKRVSEGSRPLGGGELWGVPPHHHSSTFLLREFGALGENLMFFHNNSLGKKPNEKAIRNFLLVKT